MKRGGSNRVSYDKLLGGKSILAAIVILIIALIAFSSIGFRISIEFGVIASVFTLIYGFFFSSLLSIVESKYLEYKRSFSQLSSDIFVINQLVNLSGQKKVMNATNKCLKDFIEHLKNLHPQYYEDTQKYIPCLYGAVAKFKIGESKEKRNIHNRLLDTLRSVSFVREKLEIFGDRYIVGETKFTFFSSTLVLMAIIFLVTYQNFWLFLVGLVLIVLLTYVGALIIDLDNLSYGTRRVRTENLKELLKSLEKA